MDLGVVLALLAMVPSALCLENGLARTPSMGFNTWNAFGSDISEQLISQTAGFMVNMSLVKIGYNTIVLDGAQRSANDTVGSLRMGTYTLCMMSDGSFYFIAAYVRPTSCGHRGSAGPDTDTVVGAPGQMAGALRSVEQMAGCRQTLQNFHQG